MTKKNLFTYLLLIFLLFSKNINSKKIFCEFEEVHSNKEVNNGIFLIKNNKFRYQYQDHRLLTIFSDTKNMFYVQNANTSVYHLIDTPPTYLETLKLIINDYPNFQQVYSSPDYQISIEKSLSHNFLKRISINSQNINVSIFFLNCKKMKLADQYFSHNLYKVFHF